MKNMFKIIICALLVLMLSSCGEEDTKSMPQVEQAVISALAERGVSFGMTEDEVKAAESLSFLVDTSPYSTFVQEDFTMKTIYSETTVKYEGYDAVVTYKFQNDSLFSMEYDIEVNYDSSEVLSTPAYTVFLDFTLKYTEMLGNPQRSETNSDSSFWTQYSNMWSDNEDTEKANYGINIITNQSAYQSYKDDYNDKVSIDFMGFTNN